jgi:transcriptional regulator with XRE-family HTH domain
MSISIADQQALTAEHARRFWTRTFSTGIEKARNATGRSIEEAARLAGLELSEWMALEAGAWLPQTSEQIRAIAGALDMSYDRLASFVLLCWSAWES